MDRRERLEATIHGEKPDRTAFAFWRHWPGDDQRAEDLAAATLKFQKDYGSDFMKVTPSSSYCLEDWGVRTRWAGNMEGTRDYLYHPIQAPDDWSWLPVLDPTQGSLGSNLRCLSIIGEAAEAVPFIPTVFNPLSQAKNLTGGDTLLMHMRQHPDRLKDGLERITDTILRFIVEAKKSGIAGIFYAVQHASYGILSVDEYQEFGRPYDLKILEEAGKETWFNLLHIHGLNPMFDLLSDYPVQAINWHARETPPSLKEGLAKTSAAVCGGIDRDRMMMQGTPDDIRTAVADAVVQTEGRRLIIATGCVINITTPTSNLIAASEAVGAA